MQPTMENSGGGASHLQLHTYRSLDIPWNILNGQADKPGTQQFTFCGLPPCFVPEFSTWTSLQNPQSSVDNNVATPVVSAFDFHSGFVFVN